MAKSSTLKGAKLLVTTFGFAVIVLASSAQLAHAQCRNAGESCSGPGVAQCCDPLTCRDVDPNPVIGLYRCDTPLGQVSQPYGIGYGAEGLGAFLNNVISAFLVGGGILLFFYLLFGGFKYITAGGDDKAIDSAKKVITHAIVGIIIMATAFFIVRVLETVLKISIINPVFRGP